MDNSWYVETGGLRIITDPWLEGAEVDYFPWFNKQWHRTSPIAYKDVPAYDVVLITQKYPDHFHPETLVKLQPKKMIVPHTIAPKVKKILPEAEVIALGNNNTSYTMQGVTFTWLPTRRLIDPIYDAVYIKSESESFFIASHGFQLDKKHIAAIDTTIPVKLLISPYNLYRLPAFLGGTVSPGIKGLHHLNSTLKPRYIVATHDEDKHAEGIVSRFATVIRTARKDLQAYPELYNKCLDLEHYSMVNL